MNLKTRTLAERLVQYFIKHKHVGHSYAILSTKSDRQPRYLMSHKRLAEQWVKRANVNIDMRDVYGPAEIDELCKIGDRRPLIVDHFVMTKTMHELLQDIAELEQNVTKLSIENKELKRDNQTFLCANRDLTKEVEIRRKLEQKLKNLQFVERVRLSKNPQEFIDKLVKQITTELDEATETTEQ